MDPFTERDPAERSALNRLFDRAIETSRTSSTCLRSISPSSSSSPQAAHVLSAQQIDALEHPSVH
jgi:hypothetical protein